jgi:hypothetical protein
MANFIKATHYGSKCLDYVDSKGQSNHLDYEDCDDYNDLLHIDNHFAELTVNLHETVCYTNNDNKEWDIAFTNVEQYLKSIKKYTGGVGCFRSN